MSRQRQRYSVIASARRARSAWRTSGRIGVRTIVHVAAECSPFARTGGLGEAVAGLARAQARAGHRVTVFVPLYAGARRVAGDLSPVGPAHNLDMGPRREDVRLLRAARRPGEAQIIFVDAPQYFDRPGLYGEPGGDYPDNHRRFALLSLAALVGTSRMAAEPVVMHAHDWHAALVPVYLRTDPRFASLAANAVAVFSIHNAGYQGLFPATAMADLGLPTEVWTPDRLESCGELNMLKGGLALSDVVVTVSPSHAAELVTDVGGFGLQTVFRSLGDRLVGNTNGIDEDIWDPSADPDTPAPYSAGDLSGKVRCKEALQAELGLPRRADVPLFAMSARLTLQKGLDLVLGSERVRSADAQFAFLGNGDARYREALTALARERPANIATEFDFVDAREHRLLAGADFLIMPSLYEPCGLTQMRAQRYGDPVVARDVGGLHDTVADDDTGFLFAEYTPTGFDTAIDRALRTYREPPALLAMRLRAMAQHFTWAQSVNAYADVYRRAAARVIGAE